MIKPHKKFIHDELKAAGLDTENSLHMSHLQIQPSSQANIF